MKWSVPRTSAPETIPGRLIEAAKPGAEGATQEKGAGRAALRLLGNRRGSGNVQMLILTVVVALGGMAGFKLLRTELSGRTGCAGEQIAAMAGGAAPCSENGGPESEAPAPPADDPNADDGGGDGEGEGDDPDEVDPLDELLAIAADIIGLTDAKKCITEGDILACLMTALNFTPGKIFGIGFKLIKNANKLRKAVDKFLAFLAAKRAKKAEEAAEAAGKCKGGKCDRPGVCFAPGTLVHTEDGPVAIEELEVGDRVWSRDDRTGREGYRPIAQTFVTPDQPLLELSLEEAGATVETLLVTAPHPFYVENRGWVAAGDLRIDDRIVSADGGSLRVVDNQSSSERSTVYNFEVAEFHTYFVGEGAAWVHNQNRRDDCGTPDGEGLSPDEIAKRQKRLAEIEEELAGNPSGKKKRDLRAEKKKIDEELKKGQGDQTPGSADDTPNPQNPPQLKNPKPGLSGKEGAKDVPSFARGERPRVGESGADFAKRILDKKYGPGNYPTGPGSEFNKIKKFGDRNFEDP